MVHKIFVLVIIMVLPIYSQDNDSLSLYDINGWSYAGSWGVTDMENTGMLIEEGQSSSDFVQRFNSYGWTTQNGSNEWRQTNSFAKTQLIQLYLWPNEILIDINITSNTNTWFLGMSVSMIDTTGDGIIGSVPAQIPTIPNWQTIKFTWIGPGGEYVCMLGIDFQSFSNDSSYVGVELQTNNLRFVYDNGDTIIVDTFGDDSPTAIEPVPNLVPNGFVLEQNYPNPFNPTTTISFSIPEKSYVTLKIYDMLGREIAELVNEELETGSFEKIFDAGSLSSGVYIYRITAMKEGKILFNESRQMLMIK